MARIYPVIRKVITVVSGANVAWTEKDKVTDVVSHVIAVGPPEKDKVTDTFPTITVAPADTEHARDTLTSVTGSATWAAEKDKVTDVPAASVMLPFDKVKATDAFPLVTLLGPDMDKTTDFLAPITVVASDTVKPGHPEAAVLNVTLTPVRSGSPDSDFAGDDWVDQTSGNTGVNHGSATALNVVGSAINQENDAWFFLDLTRFAGWTASSALTWNIWTTSGLATSQNLNANLYKFASKPFTESTLTWANRPSLPASQGQITVSTPGTTNTTAKQVVSWNQSILSAVLGSWVCIVVTPNSAIVSGSMQSRESANPWSVQFTATR